MDQRGRINLDLRGFLFVLVLLCTCGVANGATNQDDVNALLALRDEWGGVRALPSWVGDDPCGGSKWLGVTCDSTGSPQRVQQLIVTSSQLVGQLPADIGFLTGLQTLDLSYNNLTGPLPWQLGNLTGLQYLILQYNYFSGNIPPELGQLQNLNYLYLNGNSLRGQIPPQLGLLKKLYWLDLAFNLLQGNLPYSTDGINGINAGLDNLTSAKHFHLNSNQFDGPIPGAICHPNMALIHLLLDSNNLDGTIPREIGYLRNLIILRLDNNRLHGAIPENISQLVQLGEMHLSNNQLSGTLPDLSSLGKIQVLDVGNNSFDDATVPSWLLSLKSLTDLDMQHANLIGEMPLGVLGLPNLEVVKLDNNSINGTLGLDQANDQLVLVSLEGNQIEQVNLGVYSKQLLLQGNPICESSNNLAPSVCAQAPSSSPSSFNENTCSAISCPSGYMVNPAGCSCSIPYKGTFIFRAPSFTTTTNVTQIKTLIPKLMLALNMSASQIQITNAKFDSANHLRVDVLFFPSGTVRWSQDDIVRISSELSSNPGVYPDVFGPPMFQPYPYPFTVVSTAVSGLRNTAIIGIAVGASALVVVVLSVCLFAILQKRRADKAIELSKPFASWGASGGDSSGAPKLKGARWFSYSELKKATNNFSESNEIGSGGYGKVYRGILLTGQQVAVKRAHENSMQGATEFKNEIELLSRVHHKNVVSLVGFCFEQGQQMLIYEYMANGTLRASLLGRTGVKMDWHRRLMIALGAARGISYLHELANPPIIHRDIKSSNILLDEKNTAKVADFGLSKIGPLQGSGKGHVSTQVKGTYGYLDPEYYLSQQLTEKSDVYSYGVVLLELLTARQPIENGKYVVREVRTALGVGGISAMSPMLDPRLKEEPLFELEKFLEIALRCVEDYAANRPTMSEVVKELEVLVGHEYPESGSSNIDVEKGQKCHPYGSDSDLKDSDASFQYSGGYVASPTVQPK